MIPDIVQSHPALQELLAKNDHIDVKSFDSEGDMRTFLAGLFSYMPAWLKGLFGVRAVFVRVLGMKQEGSIEARQVRPEEISMTPGDAATFFTVEMAEEDNFYVASAKESHLDAYLAVVAEPGNGDANRYHLITIVNYNNWAGPIYFNVIRPFHHLVVYAMGNSAKRYQPAGATA